MQEIVEMPNYHWLDASGWMIGQFCSKKIDLKEYLNGESEIVDSNLLLCMIALMNEILEYLLKTKPLHLKSFETF